MRTPKPRIVVLGGVVMDIRTELPHLPDWTQAVQATSCQLMPGGKGLNQAIAASRLGAEVVMISSVGDDAFAEQLLGELNNHHISTDYVRQAKGTSAITNVFVNYQAEAAFIGWKNEKVLGLTAADIDRAVPAIAAAQAMLVTLEVPLDIVGRAVAIAKDHGVKVVLNPAPPPDRHERVSGGLLHNVDAIIPNAWEAERLLEMYGQKSGEPVTPLSLARRLGRIMGRDAVACVTTASQGCVVVTHGRDEVFPGYDTIPADTTGGSDAFCAAYAIALVNNKTLEVAIEEANAAGSYAVSHKGGAPSMPTASQLQQYLAARRRGNTTTA